MEIQHQNQAGIEVLKHNSVTTSGHSAQRDLQDKRNNVCKKKKKGGNRNHHDEQEMKQGRNGHEENHQGKEG